MRETLLLSTRLDKLDPPSSLANFSTVQTSTLEGVKARLLTGWLPGVEAIVTQELGSLPEFEQPMDDKAYHESRIPRFLKQIALLMQDELQLMVLESMRAYLAMLNLFATPEADVGKLPEEWVHALPHSEPALLSVTLKLVDGELVYEPTLDEVSAKLKQTLEAFIEQTGDVPQIASRVMHTITLPEQTLDTLKTNDQSLVKARAELQSLLDASLLRPKQLLSLFQNFSELADISEEEYLLELSGKKCTLAQYSEAIEKWNRMAAEVVAATPPEVHCRLLLV